MTDQQNEEENARAWFEQLGTEGVRALLQSGGLVQSRYQFAIRWLSERGYEEAREEEASRAEMRTLSARAVDASERAVKLSESQLRTAKQALMISIVATVIAAIALVVGIAALHH